MNIFMAITMRATETVRAAEYGTVGLRQWIQDNVVTLVLLVLAVVVLWAARGGNMGKAITVVAGVFLGIMVLGLATSTNAQDIGSFMVGLFRG